MNVLSRENMRLSRKLHADIKMFAEFLLIHPHAKSHETTNSIERIKTA